ncbi:saccharopine dehydrogenase NADP-binding domain-containing protein [Candidatus Aerophobetes bacterium]|nr:saccharopine dehydrogenase NADP-binding domain-containing protein [Candidatus Aerophobetes bacterium]
MIGVIGGYGKVGLQTTRLLKEWGKFPLRIGGRNPEKARARFGDEFPQVEWTKVDVEDDESLETFLNGCELVINCAGPSYRTSARVAQMCISKGCHCIDAGMGKNLKISDGSPHDTAIIYDAGATPGLSGLLPRWLAGSFDKVDHLSVYVGALGRFTTSGAEDYLIGVLDETNNEPLAAWRNGVKCSSVLTRKSGISLPFFPREVTVYPYFDAEAEFVAKVLSLRDGEWYIAVDGEHGSAALEEARAYFHSDPAGAVERLCLASRLDSAGRQTYVNFLVQLDGVKHAMPITHTLVLQANEISILSGSVAAIAGIALLEGEIPINIGSLATIPYPDVVIARLRDTQNVSQFKIFDCGIDGLLQTVEGEV